MSGLHRSLGRILVVVLALVVFPYAVAAQGFSELILGGGAFIPTTELGTAETEFGDEITLKHQSATAGSLSYIAWLGNRFGLGASGFYSPSKVEGSTDEDEATLDAWVAGLSVDGLIALTPARSSFSLYLGPSLTWTYYRGDAYEGFSDNEAKIGYGGTVGIGIRMSGKMRIHLRGSVIQHGAVFEGEGSQTAGVVTLGLGFGSGGN